MDNSNQMKKDHHQHPPSDPADDDIHDFRVHNPPAPPPRPAGAARSTGNSGGTRIPSLWRHSTDRATETQPRTGEQRQPRTGQQLFPARVVHTVNNFGIGFFPALQETRLNQAVRRVDETARQVERLVVPAAAPAPQGASSSTSTTNADHAALLRAGTNTSGGTRIHFFAAPPPTLQLSVENAVRNFSKDLRRSAAAAPSYQNYPAGLQPFSFPLRQEVSRGVVPPPTTPFNYSLPKPAQQSSSAAQHSSATAQHSSTTAVRGLTAPIMLRANTAVSTHSSQGWIRQPRGLHNLVFQNLVCMQLRPPVRAAWYPVWRRTETVFKPERGAQKIVGFSAGDVAGMGGAARLAGRNPPQSNHRAATVPPSRLEVPEPSRLEVEVPSWNLQAGWRNRWRNQTASSHHKETRSAASYSDPREREVARIRAKRADKRGVAPGKEDSRVFPPPP